MEQGGVAGADGFLLQLVRVPLQWGIYDAFKVAAGLPTTGAATPQPAAAK